MSRKALTPTNTPALSANPSVPTPRSGDLYYNTTDAGLKVYNGTAWVAVASGGGSVSNATLTTAGIVFGQQSTTNDNNFYGRGITLVGSSYTTAVCSSSTIQNVLGSTLLGSSVTCFNGVQVISIGNSNNTSNSSNTIAIGQSITTSGYDNVVAIGSAPLQNGDIVFGDNNQTRLRIPGLSLDTASASNGQVLSWNSTGGVSGTGGFAWTSAGGATAPYFISWPGYSAPAIDTISALSAAPTTNQYIWYNADIYANATGYITMYDDATYALAGLSFATGTKFTFMSADNYATYWAWSANNGATILGYGWYTTAYGMYTLQKIAADTWYAYQGS